ncbi:sigma-70 family RNA polymerase sigma factor [Streptomyces sp. NPDC001581]|uniref:RNA polymerase sigma factor n=1 Tax=Streptomyces sp. NPDC001581 TaxID=3154386 RepID=UPI003326AE42
MTDGTSGDALLRLEGDVGQQLLGIYPDYMDEATQFLRRFAGMPLAEREDIAQQAFLNAAESLLRRGVDPGDRLMGYLLKAAQRLALSGYRSNRTVPVDSDVLDHLWEQQSQVMDDPWDRRRELVDAAIAAMDESTQRRRVVYLTRLGFSPKEIADELGISRNQVAVQRRRAVLELQKRLQGKTRPGQPREEQQGEEGSGE